MRGLCYTGIVRRRVLEQRTARAQLRTARLDGGVIDDAVGVRLSAVDHHVLSGHHFSAEEKAVHDSAETEGRRSREDEKVIGWWKKEQ